jgi:hypothetical protein
MTGFYWISQQKRAQEDAKGKKDFFHDAHVKPL